jgi:nucleotidyltransferase substrate binding protein (TIGR01987 family)
MKSSRDDTAGQRIHRMRSNIRWKQRFENFERAFFLLKEAFEKDLAELSDLEKEGVVQRFEYTFELAWKTLKDYLIYSGVAFDQITPRSVIKQAFAAKIIKDGQTWIDMLEQRNLMSHTYDREVFDAVFGSISQRYVIALEQVFTWLKEKQQQ